MGGCMTPLQRIVVVLYCLLVAYCCLWVPWHVTGLAAVGQVQLGYGWIWHPADPSGGPDVAAITLRLLAVTGLGAAVFLLAGKWKQQR